MPHPIRHAQPRLEFIPQHFNPLVLWVAQQLLPILLRLRLRPWLPTGIAHIEVAHPEILARLYQQFQAGKIRLLLAFRHPEVDDPLCMAYVLSRWVPKAARQQGISLQRPIHSHFMYDRGMTLWAGRWLGWFFACLGGIPIRRGRRVDRTGLQAARELFVNGQFPLSVAPEGATNGHSGTISPLQPGVAQLSFWCIEELVKANRTEQVWIVPIAIQYRYLHAPWKKLDALLQRLETEAGLPVQAFDPATTPAPAEFFYPRLLRLSEHLLSRMEAFYQRFYHQTFPTPDADLDLRLRPEQLIDRLHRLLDTALRVSEQYFGIASEGHVIERCRRLEEAGWTYIYRDDLPNLATLAPFDRGLADWVAEEAALRMRHMRLAESFVAVTSHYIQEHPTAERFAELSLIIFDMMARVEGKTPPKRPRLGWRRAQITIGEPISVSDRWAHYHIDRQSAKQAVTELTQDLYTALQQLIEIKE